MYCYTDDDLKLIRYALSASDLNDDGVIELYSEKGALSDEIDFFLQRVFDYLPGEMGEQAHRDIMTAIRDGEVNIDKIMAYLEQK